MNVASGKIDRLLDGRRETTDYDLSSKGRVAVLDSTVNSPDAVYALDGQARSRGCHITMMSGWRPRNWARPRRSPSHRRDGTRISGFVVTPANYDAKKRYPTLLWIHGGPVAQYANSFTLPWQIFASQGYVIVAANPRGSSGRGEALHHGDLQRLGRQGFGRRAGRG